MNTITRSRSFSLATSCAAGTLVAAFVAWACDYQRPSSGTVPCDTTKETCAKYSSQAACETGTAYEIVTFPRECVSTKQATNCNSEMENCSRPVSCRWVATKCIKNEAIPPGTWSQKPKLVEKDC